MSDPFHILDDAGEPQSFDEVARDAVAKVHEAAARFDALYEQVPEEWYRDEEWRVVEQAADDLEQAVERAEEGYVAVQYDSNAWYRIIENLEMVRLRLDSAMGIMERVKERGGT
jgi:hypothetical protein